MNNMTEDAATGHLDQSRQIDSLKPQMPSGDFLNLMKRRHLERQLHQKDKEIQILKDSVATGSKNDAATGQNDLAEQIISLKTQAASRDVLNHMKIKDLEKKLREKDNAIMILQDKCDKWSDKYHESEKVAEEKLRKQEEAFTCRILEKNETIRTLTAEMTAKLVIKDSLIVQLQHEYDNKLRATKQQMESILSTKQEIWDTRFTLIDGEVQHLRQMFSQLQVVAQLSDKEKAKIRKEIEKAEKEAEKREKKERKEKEKKEREELKRREKENKEREKKEKKQREKEEKERKQREKKDEKERKKEEKIQKKRRMK